MTEHYPGIFKLIEEGSELFQVLAKLCVCPVGPHYDEHRAKPIRQRLLEELADTQAALIYFGEQNLTAEESSFVKQRTDKKFELYLKWKLSGVSVP